MGEKKNTEAMECVARFESQWRNGMAKQRTGSEGRLDYTLYGLHLLAYIFQVKSMFIFSRTHQELESKIMNI